MEIREAQVDEFGIVVTIVHEAFKESPKQPDGWYMMRKRLDR